MTFLFLGRDGTIQCADLLQTFKVIFNDQGIQLADENTISPTTLIIFLGVELEINIYGLTLMPDGLWTSNEIKKTSKSSDLVLETLHNNILFNEKHVPGNLIV